MINHTYTALITPFKDNKIDEKSLINLIEYQIDGGVDGIVACGTTGESPTLSHEEHKTMIKLCVEIANKRIKVMAGTGSNSTYEAVMMTNYAKKVGADSCLIVAPYYNKPTASGIYSHFKEINKIDLPIILYNIPGRSVINITDNEIAEIAKLSNVIGVKDATGDLARIATLRQLISKADFMFLSGEDMTAIGYNAMGGNGIISVTANIAPKLVKDLQNLCASFQYEKALQAQDELTPLHQAMFCQTNPIPVKFATSYLNLSTNEIRLPLCNPEKDNISNISEIIDKFDLKKSINLIIKD